jgi:hypothetical protein
MEHKSNLSDHTSKFMEPLLKLDTAWSFQYKTPTGIKVWVPLQNIESMTVDRFNTQYKKYKIESSRYVKIGYGLTVDVANWIQYPTRDPFNQLQLHKPIRRGLNHVRERNQSNTRFISKITSEVLRKVSYKDGSWDFLGTLFFESNGYRMPSCSQILDGIVTEHCGFTLQNEKRENKEEAYQNIKQTWHILFQKALLATKDEMEMPISEEDIRDPNSNIVLLIMYVFSLETPVYSLLNKACREGDASKQETLGPLSCALFMILSRASEKRLDLKGNLMPHKFDLFRGITMR